MNGGFVQAVENIRDNENTILCYKESFGNGCF